MAHGDPVEILLRFDAWATGLLLDACAPLTDDQLDREFDTGVGTLRKTLTHNLGAMRGWTDLLAGREQRPRLEAEGPHTIETLRTLYNELAPDFAEWTRGRPGDEVVTGERGGRSFAFTRGQVLTHVMTHSMHHRAQCLNMLRQMGADQPAASSIMEWSLMVDPAG